MLTNTEGVRMPAWSIVFALGTQALIGRPVDTKTYGTVRTDSCFRYPHQQAKPLAALDLGYTRDFFLILTVHAKRLTYPAVDRSKLPGYEIVKTRVALQIY